MTQRYIDRLAVAYPGITEIWLFGSQANGTAGPNSDWDYLAFTDDASILNALSEDKDFHDRDIDLFIAVDADRCMRPWPDPDGSREQVALGGDPGGMAWERLSPTEAIYLAAGKRNPDGHKDTTVDYHTEKARLVYRR